MSYITFDGVGYAYTAISLLILSCYASAHLVLVRDKSSAARWLLYFFLCIVASNGAFFLTNALDYWNILFAPFQDAFVMLGGICLIQFSCHFPADQPAQQKRIPLTLLVTVTTVAFALSFMWVTYGLAAPDPWRSVPGFYFFLLPIAIVIVIGVFVGREFQLDQRPPLANPNFLAQVGRGAATLVKPSGKFAEAQWIFALSLLLSMLPAIGTLAAIEGWIDANVEAMLIGPGSILALAGVFFAYLYYAPEWSSFSVRLVSISLVTLLVVLNAVGVFLINQVNVRVRAETQLLAYTTGAIDLADLPAPPPAALAYTLDWGPVAEPQVQPVTLYGRAELRAGLPNHLTPNSRTGNHSAIDFRSASAQLAVIQATDSTITATNWSLPGSATRYGHTWISRFIERAQGAPKKIMGFPIIQNGRWLEIGIDADLVNQRLYSLTALLILATFAGLVLTLLGHMFLIRPTLISPLQTLLAGVRRATGGNLDTTIPVVYNDEIGAVTRSFNTMTARLRDLTEGLEQKVAARTVELVAAKEHAEQASQAKTTFLANVSHELRTPLTAMLGYAELLLKRPNLDAAMREEVATIYDSSQQLLLLVNDVLDMTRIEAGVIVLHTRTADLHELIDYVVRIHRLLAQAKQIDLTVSYAAMTPAVVETDTDKVQRILMNLLGNAIKFTEQGEVAVQITCNTTVEDDGAVTHLLVAEVRDSGNGILPEEQEHIFAEFAQINTTTPDAAQGSGLGLSISRRLARLMGGDLTVSSSGVPGEGACFRLTVPVKCVDGISADTPAMDVEAATPFLSHAHAALTMLVADDIDINRVLLARHLRSFGHTIYEARNGQEALEKWRQVRPAILWLDMRMPILSGQEVVRQVRAHPDGAATQIIAVTASAFEEDRVALIALGCNDVLRKPYRRQEVATMIHQCLLAGCGATAAIAPDMPPQRTAVPASPTPDSPSSRLLLHDLRNAIGAISGLAEILHDDRDRLTPDEVNHCLVRISAKSQRIAATLEELSRLLND